jgi:hypothetical protein
LVVVVVVVVVVEDEEEEERLESFLEDVDSMLNGDSWLRQILPVKRIRVFDVVVVTYLMLKA